MKSPIPTGRFASLLFAFVLFAASAAHGAGAASVPEMRIHVTAGSQLHTLQGEATVAVPSKGTLHVLVTGLSVEKVTLGGTPVSPELQDGGFEVQGPGELRVTFSKALASPVILTDGWCPLLDKPARYHLEVTVPAGLAAISEADAVEATKAGNQTTFSFTYAHPREAVDLILGAYGVRTAEHAGVKIASYVPAGHAETPGRLDEVVQLLDRFEALVGPFPFKHLAMVDVPGASLLERPSLLVMPQGKTVEEGRLAHAILRSWLGGAIQADPRGTDWTEALTTYVADYGLALDKGQDLAFRHGLLGAYQSYVHGVEAGSLASPHPGPDAVLRTLTTDKGVMVFHMLETRMGIEAFHKAVRTLVQGHLFETVGWPEVRGAFSAGSSDLTPFFNQWLNRADTPDLFIQDVQPVFKDAKYQALRITLAQGTAEPYVLDVPLRIKTSLGDTALEVSLSKKKETVPVEIQGRPLSVTLDPDCEIMRRLSDAEYPPMVSRILGADEKYVVPPATDAALYREAIRQFTQKGFAIKPGQRLTAASLSKASYLFLGRLSPDLSALVGQGPSPGPESASLTVRENPENPGETVAFLAGRDTEAVLGAMQAMPGHGDASSLHFVNGTLEQVMKIQTPTGITKNLEPPTQGVPAQALASLDEIVAQVATKRVIYVGEQHDEYADHLAQLHVIENLHRKGYPIAVGMEMFQRPYQPVLDDYLAGKIDERAFLEKTEYFTRWGYDYHLYRPIIEYCKANHIPVVALNLRAEISRKVFREGIKSLTPEEKALIPDHIDFANDAYRERLEQIFAQHPEMGEGDFNRFVEAQVLWDETMAQSVATYLNHNPGRQMVVMAGAGHVSYGYGIPSRVERRGGYKQAILLCADGDNIEAGKADYFLFPTEVPPPFSAKLGIILTDRDGRLVIQDVMPGGVASRAGLRSGDIILAMDGTDLKTISDLKTALFFKKPGNTAKVKIKRIRRWRLDQTFEVTVGPFRSMVEGFHHGPHGGK